MATDQPRGTGCLSRARGLICLTKDWLERPGGREVSSQRGALRWPLQQTCGLGGYRIKWNCARACSLAWSARVHAVKIPYHPDWGGLIQTAPREWIWAPDNLWVVVGDGLGKRWEHWSKGTSVTTPPAEQVGECLSKECCLAPTSSPGQVQPGSHKCMGQHSRRYRWQHLVKSWRARTSPSGKTTNKFLWLEPPNKQECQHTLAIRCGRTPDANINLNSKSQRRG